MQLDEPSTTTLTVRNVDPTLKERLRVRAAHNGRLLVGAIEATPTD